MKVNLFFIFCLMLSPIQLSFCENNSIKNWEDKINKEIIFVKPYGLVAIPELGLLTNNIDKYSEFIYLLDPEKKQIKKVCKKGGGPENFKQISGSFVKKNKIYFQDLSPSQCKLLVYSPLNYSLVDILSTRTIKQRFTKLLGVFENKYFGYYHKFDFKKIPVIEYDTFSVFNEDFKLLKELINFPQEKDNVKIIGTSFLFAKSLNTSYIISFFGPNFNPKTGIFNLVLIDANTYIKKIIPVNIPKKFYLWSKYDKTTELYRLYKSFVGLDYRPTPTSIRRVGFGHKIYFNYVYNETEFEMDILINELNLDSFQVNQYLYHTKNGIVPFLFAEKYVYCSDISNEDNFIRILTKTEILQNKINK